MVRRLERDRGELRFKSRSGTFATTKLDGSFSLVYLVRNTITNLTALDKQVEAFRNAAAHLVRGGHFVIENDVPTLRRLPPGETRIVFDATPTHIGVEDYVDQVDQIAISRHWWSFDGQLRTMSSSHRYAWPAELDLMARLAGLVLVERSANLGPFTIHGRKHQPCLGLEEVTPPAGSPISRASAGSTSMA